MNTRLRSLADALGASVPVAAAGALVWGVLSVVLSPYHLAAR